MQSTLLDVTVPLKAMGPASEALKKAQISESLKRIRSIDKGVFIAVDSSELDSVAADFSKMNSVWTNKRPVSPQKKRIRSMMKRTEKFHELQLSQILDGEEVHRREAHLPWPTCPTKTIQPPQPKPLFGFAGPASRRSSV